MAFVAEKINTSKSDFFMQVVDMGFKFRRLKPVSSLLNIFLAVLGFEPKTVQQSYV